MTIKNRTPKCRPSLYNSAAWDFVAAALGDEKWVRSGPPFWDRAPTVHQAADQAAADIKRLRRHPFCDIYPGAVGLAERMEACCEDAKCGICVVCMRVLQRATVADGLALVARTAPELEVCKITVIFAGGRVPLGGLHAAAFGPLAAEFLAAVVEAKDIAWVQAGFDISYNDDTAKGRGAAFQIHVHGTCAVTDREVVSDRLSARFPTTAHIYRPVVLEPCDGSAYSLSYTFKTKFYRRAAFWATKRARPCWKTSHRRLLAKQHIELMLALADLGPAGRILFHHRNRTK